MPTYDFACKACGQKFSLFLAIKDKDKATCPACDSREVVQRFTGFMFNRGGGGTTTPSAGGGCTRSSCSGCSGC